MYFNVTFQMNVTATGNIYRMRVSNYWRKDTDDREIICKYDRPIAYKERKNSSLWLWEEAFGF